VSEAKQSLNEANVLADPLLAMTESLRRLRGTKQSAKRTLHEKRRGVWFLFLYTFNFTFYFISEYFQHKTLSFNHEL
jgi:hypothetical protein